MIMRSLFWEKFRITKIGAPKMGLYSLWLGLHSVQFIEFFPHITSRWELFVFLPVIVWPYEGINHYNNGTHKLFSLDMPLQWYWHSSVCPLESGCVDLNLFSPISSFIVIVSSSFRSHCYILGNRKSLLFGKVFMWTITEVPHRQPVPVDRCDEDKPPHNHQQTTMP